MLTRTEAFGAVLLKRFTSSETAVMTTLAVLIGAGKGLGIAIFRRLLDVLFGLTIDGPARDHPTTEMTTRYVWFMPNDSAR